MFSYIYYTIPGEGDRGPHQSGDGGSQINRVHVTETFSGSSTGELYLNPGEHWDLKTGDIALTHHHLFKPQISYLYIILLLHYIFIYIYSSNQL